MLPEDQPARSASSPGLAGHDRALGWLYVCLLIFSLPRVSHPLFPENIGGMELLPPVVLLALADVCMRQGGLRASKDVLLFIILVPVIMLYANLTGYLVFHQGENLVKGVMQTYRRCGGAFLAVLMWQVVFQPHEGVRLIKLFAWSLIVGAVLFVLVENFNPLGFSNPSRLSGNFLEMALDEGDGDSALFGTIRVAGNAGSQTTYGLLVAVAAIAVLDLVRRRAIGVVYGACITILLMACLLLSSAKMVIIAGAAAMLLFMVADRRLWGVLAACMVAAGALIGGAGFSTLAEAMSSRSAASLDGRFDKFAHAAQLVYGDAWRLLFGDGWKSGPVGWHSELVEFIMAFGVVPGLVLIVALYLAFPFFVLRSRMASAALPTRAAFVCMFATGVFTSLFHDVFLDPSTLFVAALLVGLMVRTRDPAEAYSAEITPPREDAFASTVSG